jgi:hypothetical protein
MKTDKPVIRLRSGRWVCRGKGHQGQGRTPMAAHSAWMVNRSRAADMAIAALPRGLEGAHMGSDVSTYVRETIARYSAMVKA